MNLFDGDYKMSQQERVEADRSRAVDEAYLAKEQAANVESFGVSPQVREEACEKARKARAVADNYYPDRDDLIASTVDEVAPVIAEAAYKEAKARIEGLNMQTGYLSGINLNNPSEVQQATLDAALAAIDKEGEDK
jgi:cysteine synthase